MNDCKLYLKNKKSEQVNEYVCLSKFTKDAEMKGKIVYIDTGKI